MFSICKTSGDTSGSILIDNYHVSGEYSNAARLSRNKTLDGSSSFVHSGVSTTDRTIQIFCRLSESDQTIIKSLFENETIVMISFWQGFFIGYIYSLNIRRDGEAQMTLYLSEKIQ